LATRGWPNCDVCPLCKRVQECGSHLFFKCRYTRRLWSLIIDKYHILGLDASGWPLFDYGIHLKQVPLYCDNESAIKIANNPVQHSKTKHIEIRHHFLRDHVVKEDIDIIHVNTEEQLADIFTKPLDEKRFCKLRCELNILESSNVL